MDVKTELLAPCGNEENFYAAVNFGADAVYLGLSDFSARKNAGNFTLERLPYIVSYAHLFNVKVYVAVNTVVKNGELESYFNTIDKARRCGADAFIVQDMLLGRVLKKAFPDIVLHLSTQAGVNNVYGAKMAAAYGFSRVILARETEIEDVKKISEIIETEVFVQGALCTCLSGHCYMSSFIGGNSGNRGFCRQPCRKKYYYSENESTKDAYRYALSLSDLSLTSRLEQLIGCGVKSFKIEGRMRSVEYTCASCDLYRKLLDGKKPTSEYENLKRAFNRGNYTEGLCFGQDKTLISNKIQNHCGSAVGRISAVTAKEIQADGKYVFKEGDCFKIISGGYETGNGTAMCDRTGEIKLVYHGKAVIGDVISLTKDVSLISKYSSVKKLYPVEAKFYCHENENIRFTVNGKEFVSDYVAKAAITSAVTKKELKENARKTDIYPFEVTPTCDVECVFIPKKIVNELRARAYREYFYSFMNGNEKAAINVDNIINNETDYVTHNCDDSDRSIAVIVSKSDVGLPRGVTEIIYCPEDYSDSCSIDRFLDRVKDYNAEKYLYLPAFFRNADEQVFEKACEKFDGIYCEGLFGVYYAKKLRKDIFIGIECNITNSVSYAALKSEGITKICLSKEMSETELLGMGDGYAFTLGAIKVMSLEYCPFGKECKNCKIKNKFYLTDEDERKFPVRRYRLGLCRFEIFNGSYLVAKNRKNKEIYDFSVCGDISKEIIDSRDGVGIRKFRITSGNLIRGVN